MQYIRTQADTDAILKLVADLKHPSVNTEWKMYLKALAATGAADEGLIYPNSLIQRTRGLIAPPRKGAFTKTAKGKRFAILSPAFKEDGERMYQTSDDTPGGNAGKPMPVYILNWTNLTIAIDAALAEFATDAA